LSLRVTYPSDKSIQLPLYYIKKSYSYFKGPDIRVISLVERENTILFPAFCTSFYLENPLNIDL